MTVSLCPNLQFSTRLYQHTATPKMEILHFDIVAVVMCQVYYAVSFTLESRADTRFNYFRLS